MDRPHCSNSLRKAAFALLLLAFAWGTAMTARAGHIAGVDVTYACINGCTIRIEFKAYRDCSSPITNVSPIGTLFVTADTGCTLPVRITPWINSANIEVTPVCPGTATLCNTPGAAINGIMEHHWYADYDFCAANCASYTIRWQTCCRNANINTLFAPASVGLYASAEVHPFLVPCNSSPVFNNPPVPVICQGQSYIFSQGATDPDGDSLAYALGPCMDDSVTQVPYLSFTSPTVPLGPNWTVQLDDTTGDLTIAPNLSGSNPGNIMVGVLCIYVQEWRNGQLINTIVRDLQLTVVPCSPNDPPTTLGIVNLTGGIQTNHFEARTCLGATMCFDFRVQDSDLGQTQTVIWNQSLAAMGATFTLSSNPAIADTIIGQQPVLRFCWTPTVPGNYNFSVVMHDDACPIYGISQYNFQIEVGEVLLGSVDSVIGCKVVGLCALPLGGNAPLQYSWIGAGGLTTNSGHLDSCLNHSYPFSGTYPFVLQVVDAIGCTATWMDTVVIPNNVLADAGPDMTTCANQPIVIGNPPQVSQLLTYAWSPLLGLTNANLAQPTVTLANNTLAPQLSYYVLSITDTVTYCVDQDTMQVLVYPIPESPFLLPDSACQHQNVSIGYLGHNGANATYVWSFAGGNPATQGGIGPHQVSWPTPGPHEVTLSVAENGCLSPLERDTIFIRTNPVAQILPVADQCLVGNLYNFSNAGTFGPNATHNWLFWPNALPTTSTAQNPSGVVFGTAGPKLVTVTTTDRGCTSLPDTVMLEVHPDPNAQWGLQGGVQCFQGNSHQFIAQAGNGPTATYQWSFQNANPSASTDTLPVVAFLNPGLHIVTLTVSAFGCTSMHSDTILVYPEPQVAAGADTSFCEGEGGVQLQAQATGGTAPYYYAWNCFGICGIDSVNDDDPQVNPNQNTAYFVQVTDVNGCMSGVDTVQVIIHPKPIVHAGADIAMCGQNAPCQVLMPSVSGIGPFGFTWIPSAGLNDSSLFNPCARPDTSTIYVLVATSLTTGCSSAYNTLDTASSVLVSVLPVPIADAGPDLDLCDGGIGQLQGTGTGAGPLYQYQWTPSTGLNSNVLPSPIAAPAMTTDYSLVVYSNGCPSYADTVRINIHTMPSIDAGFDQEICLGESVNLFAVAGGDSTANYSFVWTHGLGLDDPFVEDPVATPPRSTTYVVQATSNWGCASATDSVTVHLLPTPIADAGPDLRSCFGQPTQLQGAYFYGATDSVPDISQIHYAWSPVVQGLTDSTLAQPWLHPTASGMYLLEVGYATCHTLDSVLVLVVPDLHAGIVGDTATICGGDSLQLHAQGGLGNASYLWSPSQVVHGSTDADPWVQPDDTTVVTLILSEAGCSDTARYQVEVIPRPDASFLHSPEVGCPPLTLSCLQNTSAAIAYVWDFGDGSAVSNLPAPVHTYLAPGDYTLHFTAMHTGGCTSEAAPLTVHVAAPTTPDIAAVPAPPAILYLPAANVQLADQNPMSVGWTWDFGDGIQANGTAVTHAYTAPGLYFVNLHSQNAEGCLATMQVGPFEVRLPDLFIPNVFSPNGDGVNDLFVVQYSGDQPFYVEVRDRWGAQAFQSRSKTQGWDGKWNGGPAPEGTYYYYVRIGAKEYAGPVSLYR